MTHEMRLQPKPFLQIQAGTKTIELRLFDEKRQQLTIGDEIRFIRIDDPDLSIVTKVIELRRYDSFEELFQNTPPHLTGSESADDWKLMRQYYSEEEETKYGVVGIVIKLLS